MFKKLFLQLLNSLPCLNLFSRNATYKWDWEILAKDKKRLFWPVTKCLKTSATWKFSKFWMKNQADGFHFWFWQTEQIDLKTPTNWLSKVINIKNKIKSMSLGSTCFVVTYLFWFTQQLGTKTEEMINHWSFFLFIWLSFSSLHGSKGSEGNQKCIFFTLHIPGYFY